MLWHNRSLAPFDPLVRNTHIQTIAGAYWPRPFDAATFPVTGTYYQTEPGVEVLVHSQQPRGKPRGTLLLVHGLEGSSDRGYMLSAAHAALVAGFAVHRMNIRGCGGTEARSDTLYHAGLTCDLGFLLRQLAANSPAPLVACGFSLGGNQVLKLAGELGETAAPWLTAVIGVSVPIDLAACARALGQRSNYLYENRFLRHLTERLARRAAARPHLFQSYLEDARRSGTIWDFDHRVTARFFGFEGAAGYYGSQSSGLFLDRIRIPALVLQAQDDPMIPFEVFENAAFRANPCLRLVATPHGGHVGFLARGPNRFWLDAAIVHWLEEIGNNRGAATV